MRFGSSTKWKYDGIGPATAEDVAFIDTLRAYWDELAKASMPKSIAKKPEEIRLGDPLAHFTIRDDSTKIMTPEDVAEYYKVAKKNPQSKGHQIEALKKAAHDFRLI